MTDHGHTEPFLDAWTQMVRAYLSGDVRGALDRATEMERRFPERRAYLRCLRASALALLGEGERALGLMRDVVDGGGWWPASWLADPDLDPVRDRAEFSALADRMRVSEAAARKRAAAAEPRALLVPPERKPVRAVLLALHMYAITAEESLPYWRPATTAGVLVAAPESSMRDADGHPTWGDDVLTARDVGAAYERALAAGAARDVPLVLGGASQGASQAVRLAVDGSLAGARGFVAVVGAPDPASVEAALPTAAERGVRGFLLAGEGDPLHHQQQERFHAELVRQGVPCTLETVPGLGHRFPADFPERLERALGFVLDG
jgi:dienelactone hydrolase